MERIETEEEITIVSRAKGQVGYLQFAVYILDLRAEVVAEKDETCSVAINTQDKELLKRLTEIEAEALASEG